MYAGHTNELGQVQPLLAHLTKVGELCAAYAKPFGAAELAQTIGLCHDLGKYSAEAQKRLLQNGHKVDHATAGGQEIFKLCGPIGAYCVFGHHGGLPDGGSKADTGGTATFHGRMKKTDIPDYSAFASELSLQLPAQPQFSPLGRIGFSMSMFIRMLFSCLVDADFLDTEAFMSGGAVKRGDYDDISVLYARLTQHIGPLLRPASAINEKRSEILQACLEKAQGAKGLYSLTVPTGGGKTISSLAFALRHAVQNGMTRVIYVIPYTSIIEQNAAVFADILGSENVLEHHASVEYDNEENGNQRHYLSTENWDAPVVVTTNVQFFESLFASKTSKCRKLHNIANSVIIFDEAQMLPLPYLLACTRAIGELVHNFACTAVLCSATQPALDGFFPQELKRTEICPNSEALYDFFRRTSITQLGQLSDEELAERLTAQAQVLCIVSTRKQAQKLYQLLPNEGCYHLSTLMYPEHRKSVLREIRERLRQGLPCRVVATSLIEAGVDVDFPTVYRAKAGLDSVIQAAGRCNREGKRSADESIVYVFEPDESYSRPLSLEQHAVAFDLIAAKHTDVAAPTAIHAYFKKLYQIKGDGLDQKHIVPRLEDGWQKGGSFPFRSIAEEFKLIESNTKAVLIPDTEAGMALARRLREGERSKSLFRALGRYSVNIYDNHFSELKQMGIIEVLDSELAVLAELGSYRPETGLTLTPESGKGIFFEI